MNREDIERLANNLRQINAFGKGGDTNRRKKGGDDNIRVRKPNTMHYDEDAKVYWDYASNLSDEDVDRLINNNYVFSDNSFLDSKILGEEEPIVVTPQSSEGGRFNHLHRDNNNYNTAFNEPKEWLKKWWYANSNKNTPETKFLVDYVVEKTPITFDLGEYDDYEGAYNVLKEDIKLQPKFKENPLQADFVALHELNHALQNQLKAHKKAWLPEVNPES